MGAMSTKQVYRRGRGHDGPVTIAYDPEKETPIGDRFKDPDLFKTHITGIAVRGYSIFAEVGDEAGYRAVQELAVNPRTRFGQSVLKEVNQASSEDLQ